MELLRSRGAFVSFIAKALSDDFVLIDIGCSGGIDSPWRDFGASLRSYGFDPNITEIDRLTRQEHNPKIKYIAAHVDAGCFGNPVLNRNPWSRLTVHRTLSITEASRLAASTDKKTKSNDWTSIPLAARRIRISDFLDEQTIDDIDFVKIDVDGSDFDILRSLENALSAKKVIGVGIEVNYFGSGSDDEHSLHNVDRFMKRAGYELFDLTKRTYSMAALPQPYALSVPAQSVSGRPLQGDAVYLRDLAANEHEKTRSSFGAQKTAKLACMFSLIGQPDSAAEILLCDRERLEEHFSVDKALDLLAAESIIGRNTRKSHREIVKALEANSRELYKSSWR